VTTSPTLRRALTDVAAFSRLFLPRWELRPYQATPAQAIFDRVCRRTGDQLGIVFSRQSGKDELLAQVLAALLVRHARRGGGIVVAAPTRRPQAQISRDRLWRRLQAHPALAAISTAHDATIAVGNARVTFVSAAPAANARGQTADLLLVANEAQDIAPDTWDAVFDPMAASTNAPTLFMGTVWSATTLLARQMRHLRSLETTDGTQRLWEAPWPVVAAEVPAYGDRVRARMAQLGPTHPFIRTEYELRELDGDAGLFPEQRIARMAGAHPRRHAGEPGRHYALLIDVAGEEEAGSGPLAYQSARRRDSTALTVVEIDTASREDGRAVYRAVDRMQWTGVAHRTLHDTLVDLARRVWRARQVVIDATGIGAGLASFLEGSLARAGGQPGIEVIRFTFTAQSKSRLGWEFLGMIDSGRFLEYADDSERDGAEARVTREYRAQLRATAFEVASGPGNLLRWSVPEREGHDDLVVSAALAAVLDGRDLRPRVARGSQGVRTDSPRVADLV
jgi:hypothetical protein